jgi:hypothetical protein
MEPIGAATGDDEAPKRKSRSRRDTPVIEASAAATTPEPRAARGGREKEVVGFGDDIPAFLLRRTPLTPSAE